MDKNEYALMAEELFDIMTDEIYGNLGLYDELRQDIREAIDRVKASNKLNDTDMREYAEDIIDCCYDVCVEAVMRDFNSPLERCVLDYYDYMGLLIELLDAELS